MNIISQLRQQVLENGRAEITIEEFNQLQSEWITRVGAEDMVIAERERCAKIAEKQEGPYQIGEGIPCCCGKEIAETIRAA